MERLASRNQFREVLATLDRNGKDYYTKFPPSRTDDIELVGLGRYLPYENGELGAFARGTVAPEDAAYKFEQVIVSFVLNGGFLSKAKQAYFMAEDYVCVSRTQPALPRSAPPELVTALAGQVCRDRIVQVGDAALTAVSAREMSMLSDFVHGSANQTMDREFVTREGSLPPTLILRTHDLHDRIV
ncbi:MAG TPA: hypothetical protein VJR27_02925 [Candidatus Saccharimonadales bacterium]|nr:hypothetical protein [Candidatus Saccharimonadales bacterium]